jgi:ribonuclease HI
MAQYVICADGACSGNPGPGGYAYEIWADAVVEGNQICGGSASSTETTNNIMELRAATRAIEDLVDRGLEAGTVKLRLDSEYVLKGIFEWMAGWKSRGWKTSGKKAVKNVEMWQEMDGWLIRAASEGWTFEADWVKGHEGDMGNERVDTVAQQRRDEAKLEVSRGTPLDDDEIIGMGDMMTSPKGESVTNTGTEITPEQVQLLRGIIDPYVGGDSTLKVVLQELRKSAKELGIQ